MNEIPNIATCEVTAVYNNGEAEAEGAVLTIKPTTISLSFMLYLLAKNNRKSSFTWPQREQATVYSPSGAPNIDGYTYKATTPREGYIYIHFENKPDIFKEFKVDITGKLTNIVSDLQEDVRKPKERKSSRYYCISNKDIVWIAYSEFQWSSSYVKKIRDKNNQELREKRMQKFDATQWKGNHNASDAFTVDNIDGYFPLDDDDKAPQKQENNGEVFWTPGEIKSSLDSGKIQWWKTYFDNVEALEDVPDERDEVFFCLHDPLGCADELAIDLDDRWKDMEALIIAIQTGIDRKVALNDIVNGSKEPNDIVSKDRLKQIEKMHQSLLLLYQSGFCSEENVDKYGDSLDRKRIELLLGKDDRANIRAKIANVKEQFVVLLKSDYYIQAINEYLSQIDDVKLIGKNRKSIHISNLQYRLNTKDHVFNLAEENKRILDKQDVGIEYFKEEFDARKGILFDPVSVDVKQGGDSFDRVVLTWNTIVGGISDFVKKYPQYLQTKIDMLNEVRIFRNGEVVLDKCFDLSTVNKIVHNKKPFLDAGRQMMNITEELLEDTKFINAVDGSLTSIEQVTISQKFNAAFQREGKLYDLADHLTGSLVWNRFVTRISFVNMGSALLQLGKSRGINYETLKNSLGVLSSLSTVVETQVTYKILSKKLSNEISEEVAEKLMKGLPRRACVVGVWLSAGVDAFDSGLNFYRGDIDAAAMQAVAAILGTIGGVGIINEWNPIGWIATLAAGTGFALLAIFFEDGPLEELCKCCQFRQKKSFVFFDSDDFDYNGTIEGSISFHYLNTYLMVKKGYLDLGDYSVLYKRISDILFGGTVTIESKPNIVSSRTVGPTTIQEHFKKELYVNVHFSMAKMFIADIDLQIYLFPHGFNSGQLPILLTKEKDKGNYRLIPQNDSQAEFFVALFDIPEEHQHIPSIHQWRTQAEIIVLCRCNDNSHMFPIDEDNKPRYIAVREKLYKEETVVRQPETPFNSRLLEKMEQERKHKLVCITVSGDNIKRGFKNHLLSPVTWE